MSVSMPPIHLQTFSAMPECRPLADVSFSPQVTAVSVTMSDQFGWDDCRIGYVAESADGERVEAFLPEPVAVEDGAVIIVSQGGETLYIGVVMEANESSIVCQGYGRWAPRWGSIERGGSGRVTMRRILAHGLEQLPWLTPIELVDTNVRHAWSELQYRSTYDVLQQSLAEGGIPKDAAGHPLTERAVPWMWLVYGTFQHGQPLLQARWVPQLPAAEPDYVLSFDPLTMDVSRKYDIVDAVRVVYQHNGVYAATDWKVRPGIGRNSRWLRRETLTGSASPTGAVAVAETFLATHSEPQVAGTIRLDGWAGLSMRPGQTVECLGLGRALISQNQSDYFGGSSNITLGEPSTSTWHGFVRSVDQAVHSLKRGRSLITGARV